jgi:hypothetical protein
VSTALAIAAVTVVLRDLLENGLVDAAPATGADVKVTALPPNRLATDRTELSGVNLFMFHATLNQGWRNVGLPAFNGNGDRVDNAPLALDLHYLLTAYGAEDLHTDVLLGYAMQLFHETPVITRDAIRRAFPGTGITIDLVNEEDPTPDLPAAMRRIAQADLAQQVELVKITPEAVTSEEMSRWWAAFQAPYRPTAVYRASVVLIERERPLRPALPVLQRMVTVLPIRKPVITAVLPEDRADRLILPVSDIVVLGRELRGEGTRVLIDGDPVPNADVAVTPSRITLRLPGTLRAGAHGAHVLHSWSLGSPPTPHAGVYSDAAGFVLHPVIRKDADGDYRIIVTNLAATETEPRRTRFTITLDPAVSPGQRALIELLRPHPDQPAEVMVAYLGEAPPRMDEENLLVFEIPEVAAGEYLVRLRIDGAESPLDRDAATGVPNQPSAMVTNP